MDMAGKGHFSTATLAMPVSIQAIKWVSELGKFFLQPKRVRESTLIQDWRSYCSVSGILIGFLQQQSQDLTVGTSGKVSTWWAVKRDR